MSHPDNDQPPPKGHADKHDYWLGLAQYLEWIKPPQETDQSRFGTEATISWYNDGILNMAANCLDRHAAQHGDKTALIGVGNDEGQIRNFSYQDLLAEVICAANVLKKMGIRKGDRVAIFLPTIPEAAIFMLACARIGAVHVVLFGGLSSGALEHRLSDANPSLLITLPKAQRGPKTLDFLSIAQEALGRLQGKRPIAILLIHSDGKTDCTATNITFYETLRQSVPTSCPCAAVSATDPLFILYTSGTTGTPKGIVHSTGGYAVWAHHSFARTFVPEADDIFWSTADVGWITGHSYTVYAPLLHGLTTVLFEGMPTYPTYRRWWDIIASLGVTIFYTAPTALRLLSRSHHGHPSKQDTKSLRLLGSVGEPLDAASWNWFHHYVGHSACPVLDTWWQTETGGIMLSPPAENSMENDPHMGLQPPTELEFALLEENGSEIKGTGIGALCLKASWPGQAIGIWGHEDLFRQLYFRTYPGYYLTGDEAERTPKGYYRLLGRIDDVVNISGHRVSSAEIEECLLANDDIRECAAIGVPHELKGQCIALFVVPDREDLTLESVITRIIREIGSYARPDFVEFCHNLPKTSSGKIARSILKQQILHQNNMTK
ncbi:acetate--CoA ligase [Acetobacteraceae bacterium ESL0709]|nr:acetate--CoA ligase [Acetobacteraceae bacterium ESL0697]MDF7677272.1 acetate--CoA ligase [Acetobacteraceae bacterium ESL0709]